MAYSVISGHAPLHPFPVRNGCLHLVGAAHDLLGAGIVSTGIFTIAALESWLPIPSAPNMGFAILGADPLITAQPTGTLRLLGLAQHLRVASASPATICWALLWISWPAWVPTPPAA